MKLFMPMAGQATRFNKDGNEKVIKPLIEISGKKLYEWAMSSIRIPLEEKDLIFIVQKAHVELKEELQQKFPASNVVEIDRPTSGPGETLTYARQHMDESPLIVCDCDLFFQSEAFNEFVKAPTQKYSFVLLTFLSQNERYSYVQTDNGRIQSVAEKKVISQNAICGCYYFSSGEIFKKLLDETNGIIKDREIYLSDIVSQAISTGHTGRIFQCDNHVSLGTPEEIEENSQRLP